MRRSATGPTLGGASFQRSSSNRKIAPQRFETARSGRRRNVPVGPFVSTTYVSIARTCPRSCPFREGSCYAIAGLERLNGAGLEERARSQTPTEVIRGEVALIDGHWVNGIPQDGPRGLGRPLRLHVAGDVVTPRTARLLSGAARRWLDRGGGPVWTYTHRWSTIERWHFGYVSVLASVETPAQAREATRQGYACAITVAQYPDGHRAFRFGSLRAIPCPAEVGRMTCAQCRLCLDDARLRARGLAIAFAAHGIRADRVRLHVVR